MKSLINIVSSYLPLLVTIPFAFNVVRVSAASATLQPPSIEPSQLLIQGLYILGAALLGWAARKINSTNEIRKEKKRAAEGHAKTIERVDTIQVAHSVELRIQREAYAALKSDLEASRSLVLELNDGIETRDRALRDVIQQLREQKSNAQLVTMIIDAIHRDKTDALAVSKVDEASS